MSNIRLQGNPSGTGTLTIASPNTNSDFTLNLPASGGTVLLDGATQSPTFNAVTATSVATTSATTTTLAVNGNNISAVNSLGFRNRIINGDMRIDQRNAGAAVTLSTGSLFPVDRMQAFRTGSAVATGQRSTVAPPGFTNSLLYSVTTGASVVSNDYSQLGQNIEGFNVADLGWGTANAQPVTISFWVRSSVTGTYGLGLNDNVFSRSYVTSYTVNAANTWEYKTITIPGDTTGGWTTNNTTGIRLAWDMGFGANSNTSTINSWQASGAQGLTGGVKLTQNTGATFYITGVQLEAGTVASPFERRDYGRELIMCQRYAMVYGGNTLYEVLGFGFAISPSLLDLITALPVSMRATPSITSSGNFQISDGTNNFSVSSFAILGTQTGLQQQQYRATTGGTMTSFRPYRVETNNSTSARLIFSAEL